MLRPVAAPSVRPVDAPECRNPAGFWRFPGQSYLAQQGREMTRQFVRLEPALQLTLAGWHAAASGRPRIS
jgi:hypothetical protein